MGCSQSRIENEEAVSRCRERKQYMKSAMAARNAFASAHSSFIMSLKNTGAALSDFAAGEAVNPFSLSSPAVPISVGGSGSGSVSALHSQPPPPIRTLPPPPPPIPDMPPAPLQRAVSMPEFVVSKSKTEPGPVIEEGDEEEEEEEERLTRRRHHHKGSSVGGRMEMEENRGPPPPLPQPVNPTYDYIFSTENMLNGSLEDVEQKVFDEMPKRDSAGNERVIEEKVLEEIPKRDFGGNEREVEERKVVEKPPLTPQQGGSVKGVKKGKQFPGPAGNGEVKRRNLTLLQNFDELDDYFLKASQTAHEVSVLLEAARLHYHSNFADNRGHIDHSARVMRVITWNRSFRDLPNAEDYMDDFDSEENETLATVLDKLLAWEKKLYDEVKAGELMKFDYRRKVALLNKQKTRGASPETIEKIKATVSHLHTRYIVDLQAMDSTVSEINSLRDKQLHPKLVALVDAMGVMWDAMQLCHENQYKIALALKSLDISQLTKETTDQHHERTIQLWGVVQEWHTQFDKMVFFQKEYVRSLNSWLKLNLIPIESSLKEKVSSPPRPQNPPIKNLLLAWHDNLEKLPDEHTKTAIYNFAAVLHTIVEQQEDELKLRAKVEESIKDLERKERIYFKWLKEYAKKGEPHEGNDEVAVEKEFAVENAKRKVEEDKENYRRECIHVREKTLTSLKGRLPELLLGLAGFAHASSDMYRSLKVETRT